MADLQDGESQEMESSRGDPWKIRNVGGVYSCNCPAWRNQKGVSIERRTCKHLKLYRGAAAEEARIAGNTAVVASISPAAGLAASSAPLGAALPSGSGKQERALAILTDMQQNRPEEYARVVQLAEVGFPRGPWDFSDEVRTAIVAAQEKSVGRKLRGDEKAKIFGPPVLLANDFEDVADLDPTGWWVSEKLDGVRAYWDGRNFISREGNIYHAPDWFKADLPDHPLDGELWMGRRMFQKTISVVKRQDKSDHWKEVYYMVFDAPHLTTPFEERMQFLRSVIRPNWHVQVLSHCKVVGGMEGLIQDLKRVEALKGEGLMIREPLSLYKAGRNSTILKVKPFKDTEAEVIGTEMSTKGQFKGLVGALVMKMPNGKTFKLNAKTVDLRRFPPSNGTIVTYTYTELTDDGLPKCASYLRVKKPE